MQGKNRWMSVFFLIILVLFLTACNSNNSSNGKGGNDNPFDFYNQVNLGAVKEDIDVALGVDPLEKEDSYIYVNAEDGFGVMVMYDPENVVIMKTLYHEDEKKIMALSNATVSESQIAEISEGMAYKDVKALLGTDGIEIIQVMNPASQDKPIYMMIWFNSDNTGIYTSFLGDRGSVIEAFYFKE